MDNKNNTPMNVIDKIIQETFGMSYTAFEKLDFDEQQYLINTRREKRNLKKPETLIHGFGTGEHFIFGKVKRGARIMVGSGEHAIFVRAGVTPKDEKSEINERINHMISEMQLDDKTESDFPFVKKIGKRH